MSNYKRVFTDEELSKAIQLPKWRNEYLFGRLSDPDDPDYIGPATKPELQKYEDDEIVIPVVGLR